MTETVPLRKSLESEARLHEYETVSPLDRLIRENPGHEAHILRATRINAEGTSPLALLASARDPAELSRFHGFLAATKPLGDTIAGYGQRQLEAGRRAGLVTKAHGDEYARYVSRQSEEARLAGTGPQFESRTITPTTSGSNMQREDVFRDVPGGTDRVNDWVNRFAGSPDRAATRQAVLQDMIGDHAHLRGAPSPTDILDFDIKAKDLAKRLSGMDSGYIGKINERPYYSHDIAGDVMRRGTQHARMVSSADAITRALAKGARKVADFAPGEQVTHLPDALWRMRLGSFDRGAELVGADRELYRRLAPKGAGMVDPLVTGAAPYGLHAELGNWGIRTQDLDELAKSYANWITPEEMVKPLRFADSATNAFKALTYPIWLASHARNAATAIVNNMRTGTRFGDYAQQFRLMRGQLPDAAADAMRRGQYGHARVFGEGGPNLELAGAVPTSRTPSSRTWAGYTPGTTQAGYSMAGPTGSFLGDTANLIANEGIAQHARDIWAKIRDPRNAPNPWQLSGVGQKFELGKSTPHADIFAPVVAGRKMSSNIEDFFRGAQYQGLIRQGFHPEQAARQIDRFHFNYQDLAPFERNWMRRLVPFYTYARKNLPLQLETLATRPGAFSTPFKPTMVDRDKQEYVPDYLSNGFAMPIGPEHDGTRRFLSSLGLPQEEAFKEMSLWNGRPDLASTLMRYAGNLNPLVKGPLEQMTDRQFFSGRRLSDLRPTASGRGLASLVSDEYSQPLSQLISNTPLTRFATSLDKLLDTRGLNSDGRKPGWATGVNLLTGARISDVDLEKQRYLEQRNALEQMLRGSPHVNRYTEFYVRPENKELVSPEESLQLRMLTDMQQRARAYTERRRRLHQQGM